MLGDAWVLIPQSEAGIAPVEETGWTFAENALIKARNASTAANLPAIADDSGLEVDALGGAPGVRSARYAADGGEADDDANNAKLLAEMKSVPDPDRTARFRCVVAFVRNGDDPAPVIVEGAWEGRIAKACVGANGFGYDPLFIDAESGLTAGQLDAAEKNLRSHRSRAVGRLRQALGALRITGDR